MRGNALRNLGHELIEVDSDPDGEFRAGHSILAARVARRLGWPLDIHDVNGRIVAEVTAQFIDIIWIDKGLTVRPRTLSNARQRSKNPNLLIVGYSPDDMMQRCNQSRYFLSCLPHYSLFITTKTYNVAELRDLGAPRVFFIGNAYDRTLHRPRPVNSTERRRLGGSVGFIGAYEKNRAESLLAIAKAGIPVRVWGWTDWSMCQGLHPNLIVEHAPLWGEDYVSAICSFDINLCFLRKSNRDLQTTRTVEIPACGAFMIAERTDEHLEMFKEGKEAVFFSSNEELVGLVRYYLRNEEARLEIASAGRKRCLQSGYDYESRLGLVLDELHALPR